MASPNDQQLRFHATLEDDVSPRAAQLERKLKAMGMNPTQIKMVVNAVDEASPKIKEVQKQVNALPQQTVVNINANTEQATKKVDSFQQDVEKRRFHLTFVDNLKETSDKLFNLRTKIPLPLAGAVPGMNMLTAGGGAGLGLGAGAAIASTMQKSIAVNAQMEQSMVTLTQTMKDQTKASQEMGKLVTMAQKTPFQYQDLLQADVRLRSYGIPTMKDDPGAKQSPGGQGWLHAAGNMASAMNTPITQAVEAIADARQGYFVRMMSYGIRMMREDFQRGGRYSGMTYEQGLDKAIRRFAGAQEMQAKTFQGIMSNIQDVIQQNFVRPIGQPLFGLAKSSANKLQQNFIGDTPQALDFQRGIGKDMEKAQRQLVSLYMSLGKGKELFQSNFMVPLTQIGTAISHVGQQFMRSFGGSLIYVLKGVSEGLFAILRPISSLVSSNTGLVQFYGTMKALSVLGFNNLSDPFLNLFSYVMPLQNRTQGLLRTLLQMPGAITKMFVYWNVKKFLDGRNAVQQINDSFRDLGNRHLQKVNSQIDRMAAGLGRSAEHMKGLVSLASHDMPGVTGQRHVDASERVAQHAVRLNQQFGTPERTAVRMLTDELKRTGNFSNKNIDAMGQEIAQATQSAKAFGSTLDDVARTMVQFKDEMAKIGLVGPRGGAAALGVVRGIEGGGPITTGQMGLGMRSADDLTRYWMQSYARPSLQQLQQVGGKDFHNVGNIWNFDEGNLRQFRNVKGPAWRGTYTQAQANQRASQAQQAEITKIAPGAGQLPHYANPYLDQGWGLSHQRFSQLSHAPTDEKRARGLMVEWEKADKALVTANKNITDLTQKQNDLNTATMNYQQALEQVSHASEMWQHKNLLPLQRQIEDLQLASQQFSYDNLRPLERQMQALQRETDKWAHKLNNAEYSMAKFSSGLLTGEQAALDQMHALEQYNKQLQLLQLQYTQIGQDLGKTTYKRGFSSHVAPMMGLNLQMQVQKAQRDSQVKGLEYELNYGEKHYKLQQAMRTENERTEKSFTTRLRNIQKLVPVIDDAQKKQHSLGNAQYDLGSKISDVNLILQKQQDHITGVSLKMQRLAQGDTMRSFQDQQFNLQQALYGTNRELTTAGINLAKYQDALDSIKGDQQLIQDILFPEFNFDKNKKNPAGALRDIAKLGHAMPGVAGGFSDTQYKSLMKMADQVGGRGRGSGGERRSADWSKRDWHDVLKTSFTDALSGGWFRRLGDWVTAQTGSRTLGTAATIGGTAWAMLSAGGLAMLGARQIAGRALLSTPALRSGVQTIARRALPRFGGALADIERAEGRLGTSVARMGRLARPIEGALRETTHWIGRIAENPRNLLSREPLPMQFFNQLRPIRRMRGFLGARLTPFGVGRSWAENNPILRTLGRGSLLRLDAGSGAGRLALAAGHLGHQFGMGERFARGAALAGRAGQVLRPFARVAGRVALPLGIAMDAGQAVLGHGSHRAGGIGGLIGAGVGGVLGSIIPGAGTVAGAGVGAVAGNLIGSHLKAIGNAFSALGHALRPVVRFLHPVIKVFTDFGHAVSKMWDNIRHSFTGKSFGEKLGHLFGTLVGTGLRLLFYEIPKLAIKLTWQLRLIPLRAIAAIVSLIPDMVRGMWKAIKDGWQWLGDKALPALGDFFSRLWDGFTHFLTDMIPGPIKKLLGIGDGGKGGGGSIPGSIVHGVTGAASGAVHGFTHALGFAGGTDNVIRDEQVVRVHRGEKIMTAGEAQSHRSRLRTSSGYQMMHPGGTWAGRNDNLSNYERENLHELDQQRKRQQRLVREASKRGEVQGGMYKQLQQLDKTYHEKYLAYTDTKLKEDTDKRKKHADELKNLQDKNNKDQTASQDSQYKTLNDQTDKGFSDVFDTTDKWLTKIHHRINATAKALGVSVGPTASSTPDSSPSNDNRPDTNAAAHAPHAGGGWPAQHLIKGKRDGKGHIIRVGEEDDELIIPMAAHRRDRARNLVRHAAGLVGLANGGMVKESISGVDRAYLTARSVMNHITGFAGGGRALRSQVPLTGVHPKVVAAARKIEGQFPGLIITSGIGGRHASNSLHYHGEALDIGGSVAEMRKAAEWIKSSGMARILEEGIHNPNLSIKGGTSVPSSFWGSQVWAQHANHIHIGVLDSGHPLSNIPITGGGTGAVGADIHLPRVPKSLRSHGGAGLVTLRALQRLKRQLVASAATSGDAGGVDPTQFHGGGNAAKNMALGKRMAASVGWTGGEWEALKKLWIGESGWNEKIANASSGAYGIPQALPGTKMSSAGADWRTNAATQIAWGMGYIKNRPDYGTPSKALALWLSRNPHWYHTGTDRVPRDGLAMLQAHEAVLPRKQADAYRTQKAVYGGPELAKKHLTTLEEIRDKMKELVKHMKETKDHTKKSTDADHLAQLNDQLRTRMASRPGGKGVGAKTTITNLYGDQSGGEDTLARIEREKPAYKKAVTKVEASHEYKQAVTAAHHEAIRHTRVQALATSKHSPGGAKVTHKEHAAITATAHAATSAKHLASAIHRTRSLEAYLPGAARRRIDPSLIKEITGQTLSHRKVTIGHGRAAHRVSEAGLYRTAVSARDTKTQNRALSQLKSVMDRGLKAVRNKATSDHNKASRAISAAFGKHAAKIINGSGKGFNKLVAGVAHHGKATASAARSTTRKVEEHGSKGHAIAKQARDETSNVKKATNKSDEKRSKAEIAADKRERDFQKNALAHLRAISEKSMSVDITNEAHGATLQSTVTRSRKRRR